MITILIDKLWLIQSLRAGRDCVIESGHPVTGLLLVLVPPTGYLLHIGAADHDLLLQTGDLGVQGHCGADLVLQKPQHDGTTVVLVFSVESHHSVLIEIGLTTGMTCDIHT